MQRASATDIDHTISLRTLSIVLATLSVSLLLAIAPATQAQESSPVVDATPAASPEAVAVETDMLGDVLMSYEFAEMPQAPMTARMLRITLAPGASVPMHTHPGIEFDYVESGTLTVATDGTIVTSIDGQQSETTETQTLPEGSWVMFPPETGMSLRNEGDEDVVLLSAVLLSVGNDVESTITYTEGEPTDADFEGVSFVVLGDGLIQQFPDGPATVAVDRLSVDAGEPVPGFGGVAMLSKESGSLAFEAIEGAVQVTRTDNPQLQPNAIPGQEFELNDNDAAFFSAGYETIQRPESQDELTLVRLLVLPEGDLAADPAVVTALATEAAATDDEEATDTGDGLGVGAIVALNIDAVNIRAEATTDSEIVDTFPAGTQFEITGGPVEGEDYIWYPVQGVGDLSSVEGWLVTEFMDVIEPAPEVAPQTDGDGSSALQEEATGTPAVADILEEVVETTETDGEAETADEVEIGATVQVTEDTVRVREEPNAGAFIINTYDTGTEMEVLDGPVQADGFSWYQVEVIETGVVGWTAVDFLEVVEPAQ
ncbi:MAG: SH3 domain-containing protein [Chloroflexota bacterium]|nr:SH3 domain-containing protein [Chloroflexota bacterium]